MNLDERKPFDILRHISSQSRLMIDKYHFLEGRASVFELGVPSIDKEIVSLILLCLVKKKSVGVLYPFPESDYAILPLLGPLAHLLVRKPGYFVLISRSCDWKSVYSRMQKSDSEGHGDSLKFLHPFGTVGMDGEIVSYATSWDSTYKTNIVFCRATSLSPLVWDDKIQGLVIDVGSPAARLDSRKLEDLIAMASSHQVPCVVIFSNPNSYVQHVLSNNGMGILTWRCDRAEEDRRPASVPSAIPSTTVAQDFTESYRKWSEKIRESGNMPEIAVTRIEDSGEMAQELKELSLDLHSLLASVGRDSCGLGEQSLCALASFLELRVRTLWTRKVDLNRAALESYAGETFESALQRFSQLSRQLYERNARVATKAITFADRYGRVLKLLEFENTPKSKFIEHRLKGLDGSSVLAFMNYGRIPQKAFNIFIDFINPSATGFLSASPKNLSLMPRADKMILPGYPLNTSAYILAAASTPFIEVICYPWEIQLLGDRIRSLEQNKLAWASNTRRVLGQISGGGNVTIPPSPAAQISGIETYQAAGTSGPTSSAGFSYRDLVDYLELGETPENAALPQRSETDCEYRDTGFETKWLITTDRGRLYVNESRRITVVSMTYSEQLEPSKVNIGDVIMVGKDFNPRPMSDYVWDIMAMKGLSREGAIWREWKRRLKEYVDSHPSEDSQSILEKLRELGCSSIETPQAVYNWLSSDDLIGPQKKETVMRIGELLGASSSEGELWWASIRQVRSALHSAYSQLWKLVKYYASSLAAGEAEDLLVSPELDIWLSDLANLVTFARVNSHPQRLPSVGES
jgi:hypothetical protein